MARGSTLQAAVGSVQEHAYHAINVCPANTSARRAVRTPMQFVLHVLAGIQQATATAAALAQALLPGVTRFATHLAPLGNTCCQAAVMPLAQFAPIAIVPVPSPLLVRGAAVALHPQMEFVQHAHAQQANTTPPALELPLASA